MYFFPRAFTQGCTREAKRFNELLPRFQQLGAKVFGVSTDPPETLRKCAEKLGLGFELLSDEGGGLAKELGILRPSGSAERVTYVIRCGEVVKVIRGLKRAEDHADEALRVIKGVGHVECA